MIISNVRSEDIEELKSIHKSNFPFPDFEDCLASRTVVENAVLVGAGLIRPTIEGILVINEDLPTTTRVRTVQKLIEVLSKDAKFLRMKDCHVFTKQESMRRFLAKLGFVDCAGKAMVLHL